MRAHACVSPLLCSRAHTCVSPLLCSRVHACVSPPLCSRAHAACCLSFLSHLHPRLSHAPVEAALSAGCYGLIDTAVSYRHSHATLAQVFAEPRPEDRKQRFEWVQTKIPPSEQGFERARACALRAAHELRGCADRVSVLLHWPGASKLPPDSPEHARLRLGSWLALQELYREGVVQAIGVSNFEERHLRQLEASEGVHTLPMINQVELHPLLPQTELRAFCADRGIHVQAYSSLGQGAPQLWGHPAVHAAAAALGTSEAQVLLLWAVQHGISVIPRTASAQRVAENARGLLELAGRDDVGSLVASLDDIGDGTHFCWNPAEIR